MKRPIALILFLLLLLLVAWQLPIKRDANDSNVVGFQSESGSEADLIDEAVRPARRSAEQGTDLLPTETDEIEALDLTRLYRAAASADEARAIIDQADALDLPVAEDWRQRLDGLCHVPSRAERRERMAAIAATPWVMEAWDAYCGDYQAYSDMYQSEDAALAFFEAIERSWQMRLERDVLDRIQAHDPSSEPVDPISRMAVEARYPEELFALVSMLDGLEPGQVVQIWAQAEGLLGVHDPYINSRVVAKLALDLFGCDRFGGCHPGSVRMIEMCLSNPLCEPHWDVYEFHRMTQTPLTHEAALALRDRLHQLRRQMAPDRPRP